MPLALAIVPAALALAGAGLGIAGQQKSQQALSAARSQAAAKEATLQANSNAIFKKSLAGSTPEVAQQEMAKGTEARMSAWNDLKSATTPIAAALPATSTTTTNPGQAAQTQSGGAASAWNKLNAGATAKLGSYSDWENQQAIKNGNASQKLETQNNFARGDANLLPLELSVAGEAGDKLSGWGSMVSALGSVAGAAGGLAGGASAAKGASNAGSIANTPSVYAPLAGGDVPSFGTGGVAPNWANMYRN
ncbi:MAG: hypothetical protein WCS42_09950 [Verrucomicrobiota bacterium]